ncbi:MAG: type II toxin-antitoxin system RelE/ParE family toxin [Candidatus Omnitrophota bacterium]
MGIIENSVFTRRIKEVLSDDEYGKLQQMLVIDPGAGVVIPGSGGLRKLRWAVPGKGKSGGLRIIYYWYIDEAIIYMLFVYKKSEQGDLTNKQIKMLKEYVKGGLL